jgi:hypothetical protein
MKQRKANWRLIIRIHLVLMGVWLLSYLFLNASLKKMSLIVLAVVVLSVLIQVRVYRAKPQW